MMSYIDKHMKGFEREAKLGQMHGHPDVSERLYKWRDFEAVARVINPELCHGAFERRPCQRKLRYIGYDNWEEPIRSNIETDGTYVYGQLYHSLDFNGATYTIKETGKVIGCAYFEVVEDLY